MDQVLKQTSLDSLYLTLQINDAIFVDKTLTVIDKSSFKIKSNTLEHQLFFFLANKRQKEKNSIFTSSIHINPHKQRS